MAVFSDIELILMLYNRLSEEGRKELVVALKPTTDIMPLDVILEKTNVSVGHAFASLRKLGVLSASVVQALDVPEASPKIVYTITAGNEKFGENRVIFNDDGIMEVIPYFNKSIMDVL